MAHRHFGETYKWMLYGDDDTLFYLPGVLRLLSHFDPEQPLALTDNIWHAAAHPNPDVARCLPCGFNTSTIQTNHSFTPRPACPFCTRALACGTYGPRYRCNATHLADLEGAFGPALLRVGAHAGEGGAAEPGTGPHAAGPEAGRFREGMRRTGAEYAAWMARHAALKEAYPGAMRGKPTMDWEMRDPPVQTSVAGSATAEAAEAVGNGATAGSEGLKAAGGEGVDPAGVQEEASRGDGSRRSGRRRIALSSPLNYLFQLGDKFRSFWTGGAGTARRRLADEQRYVDGTPWLSAALGHDLSRDPAEKEALRLAYPFCARHDERLHAKAAGDCLSSMSGHGGVGIIFSVGLMRMIDPDEAIQFILKQRGCGGGDCLLGRVLWYRMGVGFTDPGSALQHGAEHYDHHVRFVDGNGHMRLVEFLANPLERLLKRKKRGAAAPPCGEACVWLIENVVGTHVRAHRKLVNSTVAAMLKNFHTHDTAYAWVAAAKRDPDVAAGRVNVATWVQRRYRNHSIAAAIAAAGPPA